MLVVGDATGSTSCALGPGVIVPVLPQTLSKKPRGEGSCRLSNGNDNLNRANHSDEYKHRQ